MQQSIVEDVLQTAMRSSNNGNMQTYSVTPREQQLPAPWSNNLINNNFYL